MTRPVHLTFAAAAAAAALLTACGGSTPDPVATGTGRPGGDTASPAAPSPSPSGPDEPAWACSAGDLAVAQVEQDGLPEPVAATRRAILDAALACDAERLSELAGEGIRYSFGDDAGDPVGFWFQLEDAGEQPMAAMVQVLLMDPAVNDPDIWVWPAVLTGRPEDQSDAHWDQLRALYSDQEIEAFRQEMYLGWRVGIRADGTWMFFVAGD